jgi:phosphoglycolate phosphatase
MADFPFDVVGFDLDGTLVDSMADLAGALNHALVTLGRPTLTLEAVRPMIGRGVRHLLASGLEATGGYDPSDAEAGLAALLDHYGAHIADATRPYPGVIEALDTLAARGVSLAVVTNKLEHLAVKLLDALDLRLRFAVVIGGDTLAVAKPSPEPILEMVRRCGGGRAAFVGDSIHDVEAARAAGVPVVALSFGFRDRPAAALGADAVIDSFAQLVPTLERLAGELPSGD